LDNFSYYIKDYLMPPTTKRLSLDQYLVWPEKD